MDEGVVGEVGRPLIVKREIKKLLLKNFIVTVVHHKQKDIDLRKVNRITGGPSMYKFYCLKKGKNRKLS